MHITWQMLVLYALVNTCTCIISGISGGGAGFINTPFLILLGLPPAQAVSTGKLTGLAVAIGSLKGLHSARQSSKQQVAFIMGLALLMGLLSPLVIKNLNGLIYRRILGLLILGLIPLMVWKKTAQPTKHLGLIRKVFGYTLLALSLGLQGIFSGGLGTLVNVSLMTLLGTSALEANILKRYSQLILNTAIVIGVFSAGLIVWPMAAVGIVTGLTGGLIGGHIAIRKGEGLIRGFLIVIMALSGLWLVIT